MCSSDLKLQEENHEVFEQLEQSVLKYYKNLPNTFAKDRIQLTNSKVKDLGSAYADKN